MGLQEKSGIKTFLLISFTIGYCDAITFFTSGFFSGHVLGNVIFSIYQLLHNHIAQGFVLLLSIPVYIIGMLMGRQINKYTSKTISLFKITGLILLITGLLSAIFIVANILNSQVTCFSGVFLIVIAMGISSYAYYDLKGRSNIINNLSPVFWTPAYSSDKNYSILVLICLITGCILGSVAGYFVGLSGVVLPGVLLVLFTLNEQS